MALEDLLLKFKKIHCQNCKQKEKCEGITIQINGMLKCTKIIENN